MTDGGLGRGEGRMGKVPEMQDSREVMKGWDTD